MYASLSTRNLTRHVDCAIVNIGGHYFVQAISVRKAKSAPFVAVLPQEHSLHEGAHCK